VPRRRERLPTPAQKEKSVSLWAILKVRSRASSLSNIYTSAAADDLLPLQHHKKPVQYLSDINATERSIHRKASLKQCLICIACVTMCVGCRSAQRSCTSPQSTMHASRSETGCRL